MMSGYRHRYKWLKCWYGFHNSFNLSSSSSVRIADHFLSGHSVERDLSFKDSEHPQELQQGCVPGTIQSLPSSSFLEHVLQIANLTSAISST